MSDFKAKMHQSPKFVWAPTQTPLGAYSAPPDHLAVFKGPTSKGRTGEEWTGGQCCGVQKILKIDPASSTPVWDLV